MKLNAICMVKNEADIIIEALENALTFCDNIYIFDNGSTDGTSELIDKLIERDSRVVLAQRSGETYKNQLRNRVYNLFHDQFSDDDWWYILDADELLSESPKPLLEKAANAGYSAMRTWQAQFYVTDKDMESYAEEDHSKAISERRRYYRINWREPRFFQNHPTKSWSENISGKVPPFSNKFYYKSPICRHYAQRTPEQIEQRVAIRKNCEHGFAHLKSEKAQDKASWIKPNDGLFYYENDGKFTFPLADKIIYFSREVGYWFKWRLQGLNDKYARIIATKSALN